MKIGEDGVVESVFAIEQGLQFTEERARFRALNDAVIVSGGDVHHLTDAERRACLFGRATIFGGIIDGARGDDAALAHH